MRVLLIEDSLRLQRSLGVALRRAGYTVDLAENGLVGLLNTRDTEYDVIILDLMLPGMDGLEVLRRLRKAGRVVQVLILTAKDSVTDRVTGLQAGADDYLVKPFALEELLARVQALCRRHYVQKRPRIVIGDLVIEAATRSVNRGGTPIDLTPREYKVLEYLAVRAGDVVSRSDIWQHTFDDIAGPRSNVVEATICMLRKKIDPEGCPPLLQTRRGQGYRLTAGGE